MVDRRLRVQRQGPEDYELEAREAMAKYPATDMPPDLVPMHYYGDWLLGQLRTSGYGPEEAEKIMWKAVDLFIRGDVPWR